jgi:predicted choloylglycine hydrolase
MEILTVKGLKVSKISKKLIDAVKDTVQEGMDDFSSLVSRASVFLVGKLFGNSVYEEELRMWSERLDIPYKQVAAMNLSYEASQYEGKLYGCTCATKYDPKQGWIHARTLDWPLESMKRSSAVLQYEYKDRTILSVGVPGYVGMVSGMVPGKFAITLNWAGLDRKIPRMRYVSPAENLRWVLENCDSYEEAVKSLCEVDLSCSCIYTITGIKEDEQCVIERTANRYSVQERLASANHFLEEDFSQYNDVLNEEVEEPDYEGTALDHSIQREITLEKAIKRCHDPMEALKKVQMEETAHMVVFYPKTGEYQVESGE